MSDLIGLIPAAGRGVRAYPFTTTVPKLMLEVDGVPLLQRNLELMRDHLAIRGVVPTPRAPWLSAGEWATSTAPRAATVARGAVAPCASCAA